MYNILSGVFLPSRYLSNAMTHGKIVTDHSSKSLRHLKDHAEHLRLEGQLAL